MVKLLHDSRSLISYQRSDNLTAPRIMLPVFQGAHCVLEVILTFLICLENDQADPSWNRGEEACWLDQETGWLLAGVQRFSTPLAFIISLHGDGEVVTLSSAYFPLSLLVWSLKPRTLLLLDRTCQWALLVPSLHITHHQTELWDLQLFLDMCVWSLTSSHLVDILKVFSREPQLPRSSGRWRGCRDEPKPETASLSLQLALPNMHLCVCLLN